MSNRDYAQPFGRDADADGVPDPMTDGPVDAALPLAEHEANGIIHDLRAAGWSEAIIERLLAALRAARPATAGLDVDLLARAFHAEFCGPTGHPLEYDRPIIEKVAAEYARLAAAQPDTEPEPGEGGA